MKNNIISGGVFFALLSSIRITNKKSDRMDFRVSCFNETCDNKKLLIELGKIIGSEYSKNIERRTASAYKICDGQGGLGFQTDKCKKDFNSRMQNNYDVLLKRTQAMLQACIVNDESKRSILAKELHLFLSHSTNLENAVFYYLGNKYTKKDFLELESYDLSALILASWHAIIANTTNNHDGKNMFTDNFEYSTSDTEFFIKAKVKKECSRTKINVFNLLSSDEPIIIDDDINIEEDKNEDIKKEPQPEKQEAQIEICDTIETKSEETKAKPQPQVMSGIINYGENATNIVNNGFMTLNIGVKKNDK